MRRVLVAVVVGVWLASTAGAQRSATQPAAQQSQRFRSGVELVAIDEDSLEPGDGQIARRAAMSLLDGLGPADRVGVAFIPRPKGNFTLTSDRSATERQLSASYPLGIEVEAADRNGKPHRVAVKTSRPGLDVHGRKLHVVPAEKTQPRMP